MPNNIIVVLAIAVVPAVALALVLLLFCCCFYLLLISFLRWGGFTQTIVKNLFIIKAMSIIVIMKWN